MLKVFSFKVTGGGINDCESNIYVVVINGEGNMLVIQGSYLGVYIMVSKTTQIGEHIRSCIGRKDLHAKCIDVVLKRFLYLSKVQL